MKTRVKPFNSVRNFRDFGGYTTSDGLRVKPGRLFRSGHFAEANADEIAEIDSLGIAMQADLRRPDERERQPHRWTAPELITSEGGREMTSPHVEFVQTIERSDPKAAEAHMTEYYRTAPFKPHHIELFSGWFDRLAGLEGDAAALVNCAAGKDRTGLLCALTKTVLGVGEADIRADYLLTNEAVQLEERLPRAAKWFNEQAGRDHSVEVYRPFLGVREVYLEAAFATINEEAGGLQPYLTDVLGVDAAKRDALRSRLLESD
jgi:protein-tyrosine phosphatase